MFVSDELVKEYLQMSKVKDLYWNVVQLNDKLAIHKA